MVFVLPKACTIIPADSAEIIVCLPRRFGKSYWGVCLCGACRVEASCEAWSVAKIFAFLDLEQISVDFEIENFETSSNNN